jgi:hypothetical protein
VHDFGRLGAEGLHEGIFRLWAAQLKRTTRLRLLLLRSAPVQLEKPVASGLMPQAFDGTLKQAQLPRR